MKDWLAWHQAYDDPGSSLSRRLAVVRRRVAQALALDGAPERYGVGLNRLPPGGAGAGGALPDALFTFR